MFGIERKIHIPEKTVNIVDLLETVNIVDLLETAVTFPVSVFNVISTKMFVLFILLGTFISTICSTAAELDSDLASSPEIRHNNQAKVHSSPEIRHNNQAKVHLAFL